MWDSFQFDIRSESTMDVGEEAFVHEPFSPQEFKRRLATGQYVKKDANTGDVMEKGQFRDGKPTGRWILYDFDGDERMYQYESYRVGARCRDGSFSSATGRGACSWHGGVAEWLYEEKKVFIRGTGKYVPIAQRLQKLREEAKNLYKLDNMHNKDELEEYLLKQAIKYKKREKQLNKDYELLRQQKIIDDYKEELQDRNQEVEALKEQLEQLKYKMELKQKQPSKVEQKPLQQKPQQQKNEDNERQDSESNISGVRQQQSQQNESEPEDNPSYSFSMQKSSESKPSEIKYPDISALSIQNVDQK